MATDIQLFFIMVAALLGGVLNAYLGWSDSGEPFNARKFSATIIRAAIGAIASALGFQGIVDITFWIYIAAFLSGSGVDVTLHGIQKLLQKPKDSISETPLPSPTPPA